MTSVLLIAQPEALAEPAASVLEARGFEVTVATRPSLPSALRPRAVVVVAEEMTGRWFSAVVELLRTRGWGRRTLWVTPLTGDNVAAVQRAGMGTLYPPSGVDGAFADALARLAASSSWEDRAIARMQAVLGVTDDLCRRFVEQAFSHGPSRSEVGGLCRKRLYTTRSNMRSRWQAQGLPGSPKQVLDRIVALRFARIRERGASVAAACAMLGIHRTTMYRLVRRVVGVTPGEIDEDRVWAAIEEWVEGARGVS